MTPNEAAAPGSAMALPKASPEQIQAASASELYIVFRIAETTFALPVSSVLQMESFAGATEVPGAPPFVAGIMQLRGRVVPVIDLRLRFGMARAEPTADSRVVVGEHRGRAVALVVDTAREVVRIARAQLEAPPSIVGAAGGGYIMAVAHLEKRSVLVLDFPKVIGEEPIDV